MRALVQHLPHTIYFGVSIKQTRASTRHVGLNSYVPPGLGIKSKAVDAQNHPEPDLGAYFPPALSKVGEKAITALDARFQELSSQEHHQYQSQISGEKDTTSAPNLILNQRPLPCWRSRFPCTAPGKTGGRAPLFGVG